MQGAHGVNSDREEGFPFCHTKVSTGLLDKGCGNHINLVNSPLTNNKTNPSLSLSLGANIMVKICDASQVSQYVLTEIPVDT